MLKKINEENCWENQPAEGMKFEDLDFTRILQVRNLAIQNGRERCANRLAKSLRPMIEQVVALKKTMKSVGLFTDDRELLECPKCGLHEDVALGGRLIVTRRNNRKRDSGLRFKELDQREEWFACPGCNCRIKAQDISETLLREKRE